MDLDIARHSIDIQSPFTPISKFEQEEAELLPGNLFSNSEDSSPAKGRGNSGRWGRVLNLLLATLALFFGLLAVSGWILYWRALPGTRLMGEINGLVPECRHLWLQLHGYNYLAWALLTHASSNRADTFRRGSAVDAGPQDG